MASCPRLEQFRAPSPCEAAVQDRPCELTGQRCLTARMDHSSARAAPIYQHAASERDRALADGLGRLLGGRDDDSGRDDDDGASGAPVPE